MADTFPYWPPTSPQRPSVIAGRQSLRVVEDLLVNQIPRGRSDEIPINMKAVLRVASAELPGNPERLHTGKYGSTLYDLFLMTEAVIRTGQAKSQVVRGAHEE